MAADTTLRLALRRHGIDIPDLARRLNLATSSVYAQCDRDNPTLDTLARYAAGLNQVLEERGDPRRFTAESLARTPDPLPVEPIPAQPINIEELAEMTAERLRRNGWGRKLSSPEDEEDVTDDRGTLKVRRYDGVSCGSFDPVAEPPGATWVSIPTHAAGAGATSDNTLVIIARGESMIGADIREGAELVTRLDQVPEHGDIVIARCHGGDAVRRYLRTETGPVLVSEGLDGRRAAIKPADGDSVVGVVVYIGYRPR